jgi:SAM-dependent methyltransferase
MPDVSVNSEEIEKILGTVRSNHKQSAKEFVRHTMLKTGTIGILDRRRRRHGFNTADHLLADAESTFRKTYSDGGWVHHEGQESNSGVGSSIEATQGLFDAIQSVMAAIGAKSLVDVGCGDWNWMRHQNILMHYIGVDIVPEVISGNQKYARANVSFKVCNAIVNLPPKADMALCREVIFHLSFRDAKALLKNLAASADYICATTDADVWFNSDIRTGDFRLLNLMRSPFNLPRPIALIKDSAVSSGRFLAVWQSAALAALR